MIFNNINTNPDFLPDYIKGILKNLKRDLILKILSTFNMHEDGIPAKGYKKHLM